MAVDHYGVPFSGIEPGEVDQEQHDAVRDVFFVSDAAMLVRADLFHELGGFDPATVPGLRRPRPLLAGPARRRACARRTGRTRPAPARDRAGRSADAAQRPRRPAGIRPRAASVSSRRRTPALALFWVLPTAFVLNVAEAVALVFARRPGRARALLAGWFAAFAPGGDLRKARASTQRMRRVDDGDVRDLMVRGSARVRTFFTHRLHAGDRLARGLEPDACRGVRRRYACRARCRVIAAIALVVLVAFGSRAARPRSHRAGRELARLAGRGRAVVDVLVAVALRDDGCRHAGRARVRADDAVELVVPGRQRPRPHARGRRRAAARRVRCVPARAAARPIVAPAVSRPSVAYAINPDRPQRDRGGRARAARVLRARTVRDARPHARRRRDRSAGAGARDRHRRSAAARRGARSGHPRCCWHCSSRLGSRWRCHSSVVAVATVRMAIVAGAGTAAAARALAAVVGDARRRGRGDVRLPAAPADRSHRRPRVRHRIGPRRHRTGRPARRRDAAARRRDRLAARVGRTRRGCSALLSFVCAWLPSRLDASASVPAAEGVLVPAALGSRSRSAWASPRSSRSCARSTSAGGSSRRSPRPSVSRSRSSAFAADTISGRWGLPTDDWPSRFAWMDEERGERRLQGAVDRRPDDPADFGQGGRRRRASDSLARGRATPVRSGPLPNRTPTPCSPTRSRSCRTSTRCGSVTSSRPTGVRYIAYLTRAAPDAGARGRRDPALERVARRAARPHGVARRARCDRLRERSLAAGSRDRPAGHRRARRQQGPARRDDAHRAPRHVARHRTDLGLGHRPVPARCCGPKPRTPDGRRRSTVTHASRHDAFGWTNSFDLTRYRFRRPVVLRWRRAACSCTSSCCCGSARPSCGGGAARRVVRGAIRR